MSIWIFDRPSIKTIAVLLIATSLVACGSSRFNKPRDGVQKSSGTSNLVSVAGKNVVIEGPEGFCIDRETSQIGGDTAFVLLANCQVVSPGFLAKRPSVKALLTASVSGGEAASGGRISESMNSMDRFFRSETGRTALSRDSDPAKVEVLETFQQDDMFFLRARDTSTGIVPDAATDYWRAYFDLDEQIVSVSVIGFQSDPISADVGLDTVETFARKIRSQNGQDISRPIADSEIASDDEPVEERVQERQTRQEPEEPRAKRSGGLRNLGLLRRIFN